MVDRLHDRACLRTGWAASGTENPTKQCSFTNSAIWGSSAASLSSDSLTWSTSSGSDAVSASPSCNSILARSPPRRFPSFLRAKYYRDTALNRGLFVSIVGGAVSPVLFFPGALLRRNDFRQLARQRLAGKLQAWSEVPCPRSYSPVLACGRSHLNDQDVPTLDRPSATASRSLALVKKRWRRGAESLRRRGKTIHFYPCDSASPRLCA